MHFDLTDLRLFLHVTDAGNISRGAERAHMAVSSASERIARLESSLGVVLLERQHRGVRPTAAGLTLRNHARTILGEVDRTLADLSEHAKGLRGHVRILSNTSAATEFLPPIISGYLLSNPRIDIELQELPSHEIVRRVAAGLADAGIVADSFDLGELQTFPFASDQLVLAVPSRHSLAERETAMLHDVVHCEFVGLPSASALQKHIEHNAARLGHTLKTRIRLATFDGICRLVENGVGIAIVPEAAADRCCGNMAITVVRLVDQWATRQLRICVSDLEGLDSHARQVVDYLRNSTA